ncbi:MAG: hypothetical protein N4A65_05430 [Cohaesibacter sp.]|jgi:hypothetical protein|nr:hypothetical protein [Cohaesibacter sp.]
MEKVDAEIDNLRAHVFELKSTLYRADRAHSERLHADPMPLALNILMTALLGLVFLLV